MVQTRDYPMAPSRLQSLHPENVYPRTYGLRGSHDTCVGAALALALKRNAGYVVLSVEDTRI